VLDPGLELWALFGADGTPILLTDNRSSTFYRAAEDELKTVCPALSRPNALLPAGIAPSADRPYPRSCRLRKQKAWKSVGFSGFLLSAI
jgi:hypothetical protein